MTKKDKPPDLPPIAPEWHEKLEEEPVEKKPKKK